MLCVGKLKNFSTHSRISGNRFSRKVGCFTYKPAYMLHVNYEKPFISVHSKPATMFQDRHILPMYNYCFAVCSKSSKLQEEEI